MGFFKRVKDAVTGAAKRVTGRREREKPEAPAPAPTEPTPEAPPAGPAPKAPAAPEEGAEPTEPGEGGAEEEEGEEEEEKRKYPGSLNVSMTGNWVVSKSLWRGGLVSGTLTGTAVKTFLDGMEGRGDMEAAIHEVCKAYDHEDHGFARQVDIGASDWDQPLYDLPYGY